MIKFIISIIFLHLASSDANSTGIFVFLTNYMLSYVFLGDADFVKITLSERNFGISNHHFRILYSHLLEINLMKRNME